MKFVVGGQIDKQRLADMIQQIGGDKVTSIEIKSDIDAAMAIQTGAADVYVGACNTGGGGALAMAIALLSMPSCATISMPGKVMTEEEIAAEVAAGKKAFGFTAQHMDTVVPILLKYLLK